MGRVARAGFAYFAATFLLGFVLGALRVLWLAPALGEGRAVALELPLMLGASWWLCRWAVRRWRVSTALADRAAMGALAFALLIMAETLTGMAMSGCGVGDQLRAMTQGTGAAGLAAQLLFAAFPVLQWPERGRRQEGG